MQNEAHLAPVLHSPRNTLQHTAKKKTLLSLPGSWDSFWITANESFAHADKDIFERISIFTPLICCRFHVVLFETLEFNTPLQSCPPVCTYRLCAAKMHNAFRHALAHVCTHAYRRVLSHIPPSNEDSNHWAIWAPIRALSVIQMGSITPSLPSGETNTTRSDPIGLCIYSFCASTPLFIWGCVRASSAMFKT